MSEVTRILSDIEHGDPKAAEQLLPLVYDELQKLAAARLAHEKPGQTLQATALVHEAYVRLVDQTSPQQWDGQGHFFAAAAESMRRILVERARKKKRLKRGGDRVRADLLEHDLTINAAADEILAVNDALERLGQEDELAARVLKLKYYGGLSVDDAADALGVSRATIVGVCLDDSHLQTVSSKCRRVAFCPSRLSAEPRQILACRISRVSGFGTSTSRCPKEHVAQYNQREEIR